ncbi:MAG TPA: LPS assembly lipoprotein LptE [Longimicrobiales bacterium]|nr:LPS assembly lipoprotein LptE [Longimicrobiales bacterium]
MLGAALVLTGCMYTFNQGGGFPSHIRTLYIESFENETVEFGVGQLIDQELASQLPRALGVQTAGRDVADAVMTGRITRYVNETQSQRAQGTGTFEIDQQQVQIAVSARIVDVGRNVILWEGQVTGQALYRPDTQSEEEARAAAVAQVLQRIIDGAQSQW